MRILLFGVLGKRSLGYAIRERLLSQGHSVTPLAGTQREVLALTKRQLAATDALIDAQMPDPDNGKEADVRPRLTAKTRHEDGQEFDNHQQRGNSGRHWTSSGRGRFATASIAQIYLAPTIGIGHSACFRHEGHRDTTSYRTLQVIERGDGQLHQPRIAIQRRTVHRNRRKLLVGYSPR